MNLTWQERVEAISIHPEMATREDISRLAADWTLLKGTIRDIRDCLNPDDENSYRCDDSEGAMDYCFGKKQIIPSKPFNPLLQSAAFVWTLAVFTANPTTSHNHGGSEYDYGDYGQAD